MHSNTTSTSEATSPPGDETAPTVIDPQTGARKRLKWERNPQREAISQAAWDTLNHAGPIFLNSQGRAVPFHLLEGDRMLGFLNLYSFPLDDAGARERYERDLAEKKDRELTA